MSAENSLSLPFYQYMCQKIGFKKEVKARRLIYILHDLGIPSTTLNQITSGSKGEGLDLKGSDIDIMFIDPVFKVYESNNDVVPQSDRCIPLVMDTEDTHPCFTQLRITDNHILTFELDTTKMFLGKKCSSELYKLHRCSLFLDFSVNTSIYKIHGPCFSNLRETFDFAWCLKCDRWISQARPWISRPRISWPSSDLISKIISCGVLYVPIGYKGSSNENLQWRISFSVAEKCLIFSFNHTQLLCYALLKILVKEIVAKHEDLKTLLCSYFLKTLMFWISEESDPLMWSPNNSIRCFMACLKRLIYCVEYSTLLHYFIPDHNLFYLRFDACEKDKLTSILKNIFQKGIYCFAQSETLFDIMTLPLKATDSAKSRCVTLLHGKMSFELKLYLRPLNLLYNFLHHSSSKISKRIFFEILSFAHQNVPQISQHQTKSNNKHKYYQYKRDRSHLLIGTNSDAVAGWLLLASFFYVHKKYLLSLDIINNALRKCTNENIYPWQIGLNQNQIYLLHLLKKTELCTILKTITIKCLNFHEHSPISPEELQLTRNEQGLSLHPTIFAPFLSFLCNYHLNKQESCVQSLIQLHLTIIQHRTIHRTCPFSESLSFICIGIASQMIGEAELARQSFLLATKMDKHGVSSAASRLFNCNVDT